MQLSHRFVRSQVVLLALAISLSFCVTLKCVLPAHAASPTWNVISDNAPALAFNNADSEPGIVQTSSGLWVESTGITGSSASADHGWTTEWHRAQGTGVDNLGPQSAGILDPASFTRPYGDDKFWSSGVWQDAQGTWYTPVHVEYSYYADAAGDFGTYPHMKCRLGLAISTDRGAHWYYQGDILTYDPSKPRPDPSYYNFGDGDPQLFVDSATGYFYIYYMTGWTTPTFNSDPLANPVLDSYVAVARSPISAHMAPGSWTKWYNGSWSQPGLQGLDSEVFSGATSSLSVQYNTYLGKYVMIDTIGPVNALVGRVATATDLGQQNWQTISTTFPTTLLWYNWPVDPSTQSEYQMGQTFRLYSSRNSAANGGQSSKYMLVSFAKDGALSYDATAGFSSTQGQAQWRYQYTSDESTYTDMSWDSTKNDWNGSESYCLVDAIREHPGGGTCVASRTWIAPKSGSVTLLTGGSGITIDHGSGATGVEVMIKLNNTQLWPTTGWQYISPGSWQAVPVLTFSVLAGDALHFLVTHVGSTNSFASTYWDPLVSYGVSDPAAGFSSTQGQAQWRYQYTSDESTYTDMGWDSTKNDWNGSESYCLVDAIREHPGGGTCVASRTWIAPTNGSVTLLASGSGITIDHGSGATGVEVMIKLNSTQLWPTTGWQYIPPGGSQTVPTLTFSVSAGDALHFLVTHVGSTNSFASTYWDPLVSFV